MLHLVSKINMNNIIGNYCTTLEPSMKIKGFLSVDSESMYHSRVSGSQYRPWNGILDIELMQDQDRLLGVNPLQIVSPLRQRTPLRRSNPHFPLYRIEGRAP